MNKTNMPNLRNLQLNRFLYKDNSDIDNTEINSSLFSNIESIQGQGYTKDSPSGSQIPANNVAPGTVIASCIVQSSPGKNRVELAPFVTAPAGRNIPFKQDSLVAYNGNLAAVVINKDGVSTINLAVNFISVFGHLYINPGVSAEFLAGSSIDMDSGSEINVNSGALLNVEPGAYFNYNNVRQPVAYTGRIKYDGTSGFLPSGWSVAHPATGEYVITHNLGTFIYALNVTDLTEVGGPAAIITWTTEFINATTFTCLSFDATGTPTDSSFFFSLLNNLP